jgi:hypothetical protein
MGGELAVIPQQQLIAQPEPLGLAMHCSPAESLKRLQELQAFVSETMKDGIDYGVIPGTEKRTLYQPGAQKLCEIYSLAFEYEDAETVQDWDRPFFFYRKRCRLTRRGGAFAGIGLGSCNSKEDRYAWRWVYDNQVPNGIDKRTLKSKEFNGRNNSTYVKFRLPNEDIYTLVNTIEKMACKRSLVHAVLGVTRTSNLFHQDLEDFPDDMIGAADQERSWEKASPAKVVLDMKPATDAAPTTPAKEPQPDVDAVVKRLLKESENATTLEQLTGIRGESLTLPPGPQRASVAEAYRVACDRVKAALASAPKADAPAGNQKEEDSGQCLWSDGVSGECCTNEGVRYSGFGYRCKKHAPKAS